MKLIQSVKEKIMKNDLPEGYTRLEYLQSTGAQYIDTGYTINTATDEVELYYQLIDGTQYKWIFGEHDTNARFGLGSGDGTNRRNVAYGATTVQKADTYFMSSQHYYKASTAGVYIDGTKMADYSSFSSTSTIYLFNLNLTDSNNYRSQARIWRYKHKRDGVLIRDFTPALDPSDKPCMYDLVSKQPFYNLGNGNDFSIGKKLIPVEYIANTGSSYINTGYNPNNTTRVETKFKMNESPTSFKWLFLSRDESVAGGGFGFGCITDGYISSEFNDRQTSTDKLVADNYYIIDKNRNLCVYNDKTLTNVNSTFSVNYPLPIFALNNVGTITSGVFPFANCYYFRIYDNDILVRDLIPVRDENNVGYMLDLLTNTLYANAGSGSFTIGEDDLLIRNISKTKFFKQTTRKVPKGFQEVEYLESTGTQYIDTGYTGNSTTRVIIGASSTETSGNRPLFGARDATNFYNSFSVWQNVGSNGIRFDYTDTTANTVPTKTWSTASINIVEKDGRNNYVNNTQVTSNNAKTFTCNYPFYLMAINTAETATTSFIGKVNFCKIWDNGTLVRDFVPYLDANSRPCMWDRVEEKVYYNQGTGEFSYGRKIIPVEHLESTGTQYIDTGIVAKSGLKSVLNFEYTSITDTASMLDARSGNNRIYLCHVGKPSDTFYFYFGYGSATQSSTVPTVNTRYLVETDLSVGSQSMKVNGISIATGSSSTNYNLGVNLYLFGMNYSTPQYLAFAKLYCCKITDGSTLVRDFIPCIDENNTPYMFDKVTHSAFLNAGTGDFLYGNPVGQRTETLRVLPIIRHLPLNYLESTGTQYINTGLLSTAQSKVDSTFSFTTMESGTANNCAVFGGRNVPNVGYETFTLFKLASTTPQQFRFDYNGQVATGTANELTWNTTSKYRFQYDGSNWIITNTTTSQSVTASLSPASSFTAKSIYLFALNNAGSVSNNMNGRIYHYWYTDGTNTIDLIPVLKLPERIPCMYDRVSKTYFYNESTDPFLYS